MLTRREFSVSIAATVFSARTLAQGAGQDIRQILATDPNPALTYVGQMANKPAAVAAAGERALGSGVNVTTADKWLVASVTKSIAASLAARLVEARAVGWDDTVGKVLDRMAPNMLSSYRQATLGNLLTHRAGLRENVSIFDYIRYRRHNPDARDERQDYVRKSLSQIPLGPAGSTFGYSNNGYIVAAAMLEVVTGRLWEDLMREHVFSPLQMTDAGFGPPGSGAVIDQPRGHMSGLLGGKLHPISPESIHADNPAVMHPCGGVHVSLRDMALYLKAHRDRTGFLRDDSWQMLHTAPPGGDYAMGWFVRADGKLQHGGWNRRWIALVSIDRKADKIAFTATNSGDRHNGYPAVEEAIRRADIAAAEA